jgi:hypothetical protein
MPQALFTINLTNFIGGRNTTVSEPLVKENESADELNIKSRPLGVISRRDGSIRYYPDNFGNYPAVGTGLHKLYRARDANHITYVYVLPNLWAVAEDGTRTLIRNDFHGEFCEFASMKDQAYGTNYRDLPFRAFAGEIHDAELAWPAVPDYRTTGSASDGTSLATSVSDSGSKHSMGFSAYRFRAYFGKDLGESPFCRATQLATRIGVGAGIEIWFTAQAGFWGFNSGDPLAQNRVDLNLAGIVMPTGATKLRIYRTQVLSSLTGQGADFIPPLPSREQVINAPYYFLDEVDATGLGIYPDRKSDDDLGALADPDAIYHQYSRYVEEHNNRLFYANVNERWLDRATIRELDNDGHAETIGTEYKDFPMAPDFHATHVGVIFWYTVGPVAPCRVYFTNTLEPSRMEAFIDVRPEDGDQVTMIRSLGPILVVLKRRHIYAVTGEDFADFVVRLVDDSVGCVAPLSVAKYRGHLYFYSGESVYRTDGNSVVEVGQNIRTELRGAVRALKPFASAIVHEDDYLLSLRTL